MKDAVKSIICISDTHFGCKMGLCPPQGVPLDGGGTYSPSRPQRVVWEWWREFWQKWVPMVTEGQPYSVVHNGDVIDGCHHNSTTQISHDLEDQGNLAVACMAPIVERCRAYYSVRGTEAHVGQSGVEEERIAKRLGAVKNKYGQSARFDLWLSLGAHRIHFLHHVGTTGSSAHESSAVNAELTAEFVEAARWGTKPPSCIVRCLSEDTEVLTRSGWKNSQQYKYPEEVMQWNPLTNILNWQMPTAHVRNPSEPEMVNIVGKGIDLMVTPDHNMVARKWGSKSGAWNFIKADQFVSKTHTVPVSGIFNADSVGITPAFAWVMGLFIADGTWVRNYTDNGRVYAARICQRKSRIDHIVDMVSKAGIIGSSVHKGSGKEGRVCWDVRNSKTVTTNEDCLSVYIRNFEVHKFTSILNDDKSLSAGLMNMTGDVFDAFLAGMMYGDGAASENKFFNNNKTIIDQLQELLTKNGYKTKASQRCWYTRAKDRKIQTCYTLNFRKAFSCQLDQIRKKTKIIKDYRGGSWCVSVPSGCIVVRRNGGVAIVGNSHRHSHIEVRIPTGWGSATATVTPGWQLKTPFTYKIAGARLKPPQFGGILLRVDKYGELYTKAFIRSITQD